MVSAIVNSGSRPTDAFSPIRKLPKPQQLRDSQTVWIIVSCDATAPDMSIFYFLLLMLQLNPMPTGNATGIVSANGRAAPGVRVFAIPAGSPDSSPTVYEGQV